jgi:radical SAM protein with 4Fe4S-binding SPASM domain
MDCPYIPTISYETYRSRIREKYDAGQRFPFTGSIELTFRCNIRCKHCYVSHGHTGIKGLKELSYHEIQRIFDQIADEGCLWLLITGGEPLLRRDFIDIWKYTKRKGFLATLFTNGTMVTKRIAEFIAEYPPFNLEISMYGYSQETYERVTGIPGSHKRFMQGLDNLDELGLSYKLKTVLMTINHHELPEMRSFAEERGKDFRFDAMLNAGVDSSSAPFMLRLKPEQIIQLELMDTKRFDSMRSFRDNFKSHKADKRYLYHCGAGMHSFHIDPFGELSICMISRQQSYDLRKGTFRDGWQNFLKDVRYQPPPQLIPCHDCELYSFCDQCPGWSYLEHGEPGKSVDFVCRVTQLRAAALEEISNN